MDFSSRLCATRNQRVEASGLRSRSKEEVPSAAPFTRACDDPDGRGNQLFAGTIRERDWVEKKQLSSLVIPGVKRNPGHLSPSRVNGVSKGLSNFPNVQRAKCPKGQMSKGQMSKGQMSKGPGSGDQRSKIHSGGTKFSSEARRLGGRRLNPT